jgi:amino acid adenylation domain-containing protein
VLPELAPRYVDFANWQRRRLEAETLEAQLAHWRRQLEGAPALLTLPTDRPRPAIATSRGSRLAVVFADELAAKLRKLGHLEGATLFMTLLAGFQALLSRYAGQESVVVGCPVAGRTHRELEGLVGLFVNTLAIRADLSGSLTFRQLLAQVRETTLLAYANQELPFGKVVEALCPVRSLSHGPLFQVLFQLRNLPRSAAWPAGLNVAPFDVDLGVAPFDLALDLSETDGAILCKVDYDADLFEAGTIDRMLRHYQALMIGAVAGLDRPVFELPLLDEAERRQVVVEWNSTAVDYPRDRCVHQLFEEQAQRAPQAVAAVHGGRSLTYGQLDALGEQLALHLRSLGVGPDVLVGLYVERSLEQVVGLIGVLKAGGAYLPLDPTYPADRLRFMMDDARPKVLLTQRALANELPAHSAAVVCLDAPIPRAPERAAGRSGGRNGRRPGPTVPGPDSLAYVLYTSGSTGRPKGVQIRQRSLVNLLSSMRQEPGLMASDTLLAVTTLAFDIAALELFLPLTTGARVVMAAREVATDGRRLARLIEESGATVLQATPATWRMLLESRWKGNAKLKALCGGEALARDLADRLLPLCAELWNLYGPTETTIYSAVWRVRVGQPIVIGRPIANTRAYVMDAHSNLVPVGVPGELFLAGDGLARGYVNRPEETSSRFVASPLSPSERLYRTGDTARWLADGNLEYLGRIDDQVKLRGVRIELGEIESVLNDHEQVGSSVVAVHEPAVDDQRLIAYWAPRAAMDQAEPDFAAYLRVRLPAYMIPSTFVRLSHLPLTSNGKVDRKALPAPPRPAPPQGTSRAPRSRVEELLAAIWREVLRRERVGVDDSFFEMGGHSLLAARVIARACQALAIEVPLRVLFESPTIAGMAARLEEARRQGMGLPTMPPLKLAPRQGPIPLSFAQERLWFLDKLEPGSATYNVPLTFRMRGPLDAKALHLALRGVERRHDVLRTTYGACDGWPAQVVATPAAVSLNVIDLVGFPGPEAEALRLASEEARAGFDLENAVPVRASLWRLAEQDHLLLVTIHHIAVDGWSLSLLARELSALYQAFAGAEPSPLAELPLQYADYAVWQREWLRGEVLERQVAYWRERLAGAPAVLELATDRPRPAVRRYRGDRRAVQLDDALTQSLKELAQREGVTLFMALLAGFQALLARYSGQEDVVVGIATGGRAHPALEGLIGLFVNTLALRTDLSGNPTFQALLGRVKGSALGAYAHQDVPFEKLVEDLRPARSLSHTPVFQVLFALRHAPAEPFDVPGLHTTSVPIDTQTSKFDLSLGLEERGAGLAGAMEYDTDLFDAETIDRMLRHYGVLLKEAVAHPDRPLSELSLLDDAERRRVLVEFNATAVDDPSDRCVHHLFEEQARRSPGAVALVCGPMRLSYRELNAQANRLAHHLIDLGVGPDILVGLCLERSAELVVALLAILKAGGAYLPLDPRYPRDRLAYLLDDSGATVLLTQSRLEPALPTFQVPLVRLDTDGPAIRQRPDHDPRTGVTRNHLAYVMYTSGTTGQPKGACIEHRGPTALMEWSGATFTDDDLAAVLFSTSICFDISVFEVFGPLCRGGGVVLVENLLQLADGPLAEPVTYINTVPSALATLLHVGRVPASAKVIALAGEPLTRGLADRCYRLPSVRAVYNLYGPTEDTVYSTYALVERSAEVAPPIGRPITNTFAYVLDGSMQPVPLGVPGELYLGGAGQARGYLNRPALTAERFVPNPFGGQASRLYRTGDRVRWRTDGMLEYLGRVDRQLKMRGFRIEPGEVEATLAGHPAVSEAVVVSHEGRDGDHRLVGYVVPPRQAPAPRAEELREYLNGRLPQHMVPSTWVVLDRLPLTAHGKLDRSALPAPEASRPEDGPSYVAPRGPTEEVLAGIWQEVLELEKVGVDDDFFALGGHSLLAIRLLAIIERELGQKISVATLFERPTVAGLADRFRSGARRPARPHVECFHRGTNGPTFVFLPSLFGHCSEGRRLSLRLPPEIPYYGLSVRGDEPYWQGCESLADIARGFIKALVATVPRGPYVLAGYSFGGRLAFEMARRMQAQGLDIGHLIIIDTGIHPGPRSLYDQALRDVPSILANLPGLAIEECLRSPNGASRRIYQKVKLRLSMILSKQNSENAVDIIPDKYGIDNPDLPELYQQRLEASVRAFQDYQPGAYRGDALVIRCKDRPLFHTAAPDLGWGRWIDGRINVVTVPGHHESLFNDAGVDTIAREVLALRART